MRVSSKRLIWLAKNLQSLLDAGIPITRSLEILQKQASGRMEGLLHRVRSDIEGGKTLTEAFQGAGALPPLFMRLLEVGEESGALERTLGEVARFYEMKRRLWRSFLAGITYPVLEYVLAIAVVAFVFWVLGSFGISVGDPGSVLLLGYGVPATAVLLYFLLGRHLATARFVQEGLLRVPLLGGIVRSMALARFSLVMRLTLNAALPMGECLQRSLEATSNSAFAARAPRAAAALEEGRNLTDTMEAVGLFPGTYLEMVCTAEQAGKLTERFDWLASRHAEKAERSLKVLVAVLAKLVWVLVAAVIVVLIFRLFSMYAGALSGGMGGR